MPFCIGIFFSAKFVTQTLKGLCCPTSAISLATNADLFLFRSRCVSTQIILNPLRFLALQVLTLPGSSLAWPLECLKKTRPASGVCWYSPYMPNPLTSLVFLYYEDNCDKLELYCDNLSPHPEDISAALVDKRGWQQIIHLKPSITQNFTHSIFSRTFTYKRTTPFISSAWPDADLSQYRLSVVLTSFRHSVGRTFACIRFSPTSESIPAVITRIFDLFKPASLRFL